MGQVSLKNFLLRDRGDAVLLFVPVETTAHVFFSLGWNVLPIWSLREGTFLRTLPNGVSRPPSLVGAPYAILLHLRHT